MEKENWVIVSKTFLTVKEAETAAEIVKITESRLSSIPRGPQYDIETEVYEINGGWQLRWRKVFIGNNKGCQGCTSCKTRQTKKNAARKGKVLEFKSRKA